MNLDEMTIGEFKKLSSIFTKTDDHPYEIGRNYFIRTVSMIQIGKLVKVTENELVLLDAVWVADTGRFTQALADGTLDEVELFPKGETIVGRGSVVDACIWKTEVPSVQK